ncbi:MAG TPA: cytochrome ubiquinol oxidase subunit I [Pyrinomonadaceae bacterium]|nr:cytochrome ubiquinol oxidase subunit I [Pyrinomonadaceae bacterium]
MEANTLDRIQFAFTITYHYLFPQLTMGLAPLIVVFKSLAIWKNDERWNEAARFWGKIFGITFLFGVVTGIPMEFQFGTNWAAFSRYAGGVIGQTLAMEGVFAFFLESAFIGLFLFGEKRLGQRLHLLSAVLLFVGTWLSGWFIIATNAWMQHPVGYEIAADGSAQLTSFWALVFNEWAIYQYMHNMGGAFVTGSFAVASLGAFYVLSGKQIEYGKRFLKVGVIAACVGSIWMTFPSGDWKGQLIAKYQPVTLAAMEGLFETQEGAPLVLIGQPDMEKQRLDNAIHIPKMLSFLSYQRWEAEVRGLNDFPKDQWPDNVPLLYYSYHIMVGLGTIFIAIMVAAAFWLWRGWLFRSNWLLWIVMLAFPLPFIANTAGWMTAELGRQPWLVYGLLRTEHGHSPMVSAGNVLFTLLGFFGMYTILSLLYIFLILRRIEYGVTELALHEEMSGETGAVS